MFEIIVLGGGCFWCTEAVFSRISGVIDTTPGYAGGIVANPTYEAVCNTTTGHAEVVRIAYDPEVIKLDDILEIFFEMHDPTQINRQGNDIGSQYRSIILYTGEPQLKIIEDYISTIKKRFSNPIATEVRRLDFFYEAEKDHVRYYDANQDAPYCRFVISPKLEKIKHKFAGKLK